MVDCGKTKMLQDIMIVGFTILCIFSCPIWEMSPFLLLPAGLAALFFIVFSLGKIDQ